MLIERGKFPSVTKVNLDMLEKAKKQFVSREKDSGERPNGFMELTLVAYLPMTVY